jgi:hypothetical protein
LKGGQKVNTIELEGSEGKEYAHRIPIMLSMLKGENPILCLGDKNNNPIPKALRKAGYDVKTADIEESDFNGDLNTSRGFGKRKFQTIIAGDVFEHVFHLKHLLKVVFKSLSPSGYIILSVPNSCSIVDRLKVLIGRLPMNCALGDMIDEHGHVRDFNWTVARWYLNKTGFHILEEKTDGITFRGKMLFRMCPKTWGTSIIISAIKKKSIK